MTETLSLSSESLSEDNDNVIKIEDLIETEPMYHVLAEFLETKDNKNIATVLQEICEQLKQINLTISSLRTSSSQTVVAEVQETP
jgi:hypothetical protein